MPARLLCIPAPSKDWCRQNKFSSRDSNLRLSNIRYAPISICISQPVWIKYESPFPLHARCTHGAVLVQMGY
jgi:hypothetical protein